LLIEIGGIVMNPNYRTKVALSSLFIVLALSGCSAAPADGTALKEEAVKTESPDGQNRQNGFVRPDLMGEVQSIIGNSITIALAKVPTRDTTATGTGQGMPPADGQMPSGAPPDGQGAAGGQGSQTRTQRAMTLTLTGETKEILIPVGIEIMSGMGKSAKVVDIADIKKGDTIMIYYATGTENIEKITIR
jgi:hypothetical protein